MNTKIKNSILEHKYLNFWVQQENNFSRVYKSSKKSNTMIWTLWIQKHKIQQHKISKKQIYVLNPVNKTIKNLQHVGAYISVIWSHQNKYTTLQRIAIVTFDDTEYDLEKSTNLQRFVTRCTKLLNKQRFWKSTNLHKKARIRFQPYG